MSKFQKFTVFNNLKLAYGYKSVKCIISYTNKSGPKPKREEKFLAEKSEIHKQYELIFGKTSLKPFYTEFTLTRRNTNKPGT